MLFQAGSQLSGMTPGEKRARGRSGVAPPLRASLTPDSLAGAAIDGKPAPRAPRLAESALGPNSLEVVKSAASDWAAFPSETPEGSFFVREPAADVDSPASSSSSADQDGQRVGLLESQSTSASSLAAQTQQGGAGLLALPSLESIPARYVTVAQASLAFVLANMDKVNLSVAIIPMAHQFGWSASTSGLVQSSFFWGYALSLVPSGWMAARFTGQRVLKAGVVMWSLATAAVPLCTATLPLLMLSRVLVGFGEGVAPPAATDLVARLMPANERTRAVSAVFNGFNVGSILGLLVAPFLIENYGWESVFYFFGLAGILWSISFNPPVHKEEEATQVTAAAPAAATAALPSGTSKVSLGRTGSASEVATEEAVKSKTEHDLGVPWRAIIQRRAVWALVYIHFCNNWGHFCVLAWLPTFYNEGLHMNLGQSALVSIAPPVLSLLVSAVVAPLADGAVHRGADVTLVRKAAQAAAFLVPAFTMGLVGLAPGLGLPFPPWLVVSLLSVGLGFSSCSYAGLFCAHQDMSPRYASVLLGLSTTVGAIPGIVGVPLTGAVFDLTHSWGASLFLPSIFFYLTGTLVWALYADCRPQHFEEEAQRRA